MKKIDHLPVFYQVIVSRLIILVIAVLLSLLTTAQLNTNTKPVNELFAGFSAAGKGPGSFNYGANISYSHSLKGKIAVIGDAGIYLRKNGPVNYKHFQLFGGAELRPTETRNKKIFLSPHLLFGSTAINSKYKSETTSFNDTQAGFTIAAGTNIVFPINNKIAFAVRTDYTPTLMSGDLNHDFRIGAGVKVALRTDKVVLRKDKPNNQQDISAIVEKIVCKASKVTEELKISLPLDKIEKTIEEVANKIPRVEAKISIKPQVTVKKGEECCSSDKPPATYTEIKGGWEGSFEININLWGIPDINYSLKIWPVLIIAEFKCKLFAGPTGKISIERVGKFYGELGGTPRPDCKSCVYHNLKGEGFLRGGVKAGGSIKIFHWTPFGGGKAGFDVTGEPDEQLEVSAEASISVGNGLNATYTEDQDCVKPRVGLHGVFFLGKAKANLKFNVKLGPISFDPNFEINLYDGTELKF